MFEKITKGKFHAQFTTVDGTVYDFNEVYEGENNKVIVTTHKEGDDDIYASYPTAEEAKANAEFITYCFNLQQRFDISKLEEVVEFLSDITECTAPDNDTMSTFSAGTIFLAKSLLVKIRKS